MAFDHDFKRFPELTNEQLNDLRFMSPHIQIEEDFYANVEKVHDGDTITLRVDFRDFSFPLRFDGIDAPELNAGGDKAKEWLKSRLEGRDVTILINRENRVGKYGRLIGRVLSNGMDVGDEMLRLGLVNSFELRRETDLPKIEQIYSVEQWF